MIAVTGVLLCGCCLVGDWKGELLEESKSRANKVAESREVIKETEKSYQVNRSK